MTEDENNELKRNQQKLSQNLQQLEKITARVKHLVGLADKSFKKKWEELEKSGKSNSQSKYMLHNLIISIYLYIFKGVSNSRIHDR